MSGMLASVANLEEALLVQAIGVDIIDLKQPQQGALGALAVTDVQKIVATLAKQTVISATIGDLPMQAELIYQAVQKMAATGVKYVKIGFFPQGDTSATLEKLTTLTAQGLSLIAVLFADAQPDFSLIPTLKTAGFKGVMLDTMAKNQGSLLQILPLAQLKAFVELAHAQQLLCGLAGSLRHEDIHRLLPLKADYLGFRGALCQQHNRRACLDVHAVMHIKQAMVR
jgi:uncharacterized protein (UPF0264 family)